MITDSQIKDFLDQMWDEYFNHFSDNEFSTYADKDTCMMFEFEDFIDSMSHSDMAGWIETFTPKDYDTESFYEDDADFKLIKSACSRGTDIIINLTRRPCYA